MAAVRPELARRIVWEAEAVHAKFPERFHLVVDRQGQLAWEGEVPVEGTLVPVIVTYPASYPARPPSLETTLALPVGCPHLLGRIGNRTSLCWIASAADRPHRRWDPQRHTAATVLRAVQRWFLALFVWQALGEWPVADGMSYRLS